MNRLICLTVITVFILLGCKKKPDYAKYIPKNASNVICINMKTILEKLKNNSITIEKTLEFKKRFFYNDDYDNILNKINMLKDAGIDWENQMLISSFPSNTRDHSLQLSTQIIVGLESSSKWENFLKKQSDIEIKKSKDFSFTNKNDLYAGWTDRTLVINIMQGASEYYSDTIFETKPKNNSNEEPDNLKKIFAQKKSESILSIEKFNDLFQKPFDIAIFSQASLNNIWSRLGLISMPSKIIEEICSHSRINFENGKVTFENNSFLSEKIAEIVHKYPYRNADLSLIKNYPYQNINGFVVFSFNPQIIPELAKESGLNTFLSLMQSEISLDDLSKAFKGDFAFIMSDFNVKPEEIKYKQEGPFVRFLFTAPIGDYIAFEKIMAFIQKMNMYVRKGNTLVPSDYLGNPESSPSHIISFNKEMLIVATDTATLSAYQNKTRNINLPSEIISVQNKSLITYFDISKFLTGIEEDFRHSYYNYTEERKILDEAKATFKSVWSTTDNCDRKLINSIAELILNDKNKNSLAQICRFIIYFMSTNILTYQKLSEPTFYDSTGSDRTAVDSLIPRGF